MSTRHSSAMPSPLICWTSNTYDVLATRVCLAMFRIPVTSRPIPHTTSQIDGWRAQNSKVCDLWLPTPRCSFSTDSSSRGLVCNFPEPTARSDIWSPVRAICRHQGAGSPPTEIRLPAHARLVDEHQAVGCVEWKNIRARLASRLRQAGILVSAKARLLNASI